MLKHLLAILNSGDGPASYTVLELAARVGASADDVRLALWQLEQLRLVHVSACSRGESSAGCEGCPAHDQCAVPVRAARARSLQTCPR